MTRPQLRIR